MAHEVENKDIDLVNTMKAVLLYMITNGNDYIIQKLKDCEVSDEDLKTVLNEEILPRGDSAALKLVHQMFLYPDLSDRIKICKLVDEALNVFEGIIH